MTLPDTLWAALTVAAVLLLAHGNTRARTGVEILRPTRNAQVLLRQHDDETARLADRARTLAAAHDYWRMHTERLLVDVAPPAPDPGNPGATLRLVEDPHGAITIPRGRLLLAVNPATGLPVAVEVPPDTADPLAAAAWTYDTDPDTYRGLARRT